MKMGLGVYIVALLAVFSPLSLAYDPDKIDCCQCSRMEPFGANLPPPQVLPSPFRIKVRDQTYKLGAIVEVNIETNDPGRSFHSFMIQARRINDSFNVINPIGYFEVSDQDIDTKTSGVCDRTNGAALISTDTKPKQNVRLFWTSPSQWEGHLEFRASFIEDEKTFWVREKSRPLYDPTKPIPPNKLPKYVPPPIAPVDTAGCGTYKGCYREPKDCIEIGCEYLFTWREVDTNIQFEMSALTDGFNDRYFAVGLSKDIYMGDDLVLACVHNSSNDVVQALQAFNDPRVHKNRLLNNPYDGITSNEGSYNNGRLRCRFTRQQVTNYAEIGDFPLASENFHLLMARGPAWKGNLLRHGLTVGQLPASSPEKVSLLINDDISGRARYHLVKAHACLMLLAWVFFAPVGLIWYKYYTTMWPNKRFMGQKYASVVHFNCTFWVVLLVIIGFILIFVEVGGYSEFPDLPQRAHPILGIIIFCCVLIIPIIGLITCPEGHACRPCANWFYWLFWTIAFCLAIPNIFIGMDFGKPNVPWWLTWILCIYFIFHLVCEVILEVHQCCTHKKNKERRKKYELQKKENPKAHIPEPEPAGRVFKRNVLLTHFIVAVIVTIIAVIVVAVA